MAYIHGFTTAATIVKDLATTLTTSDTLTPANNWELAYPASLEAITNKACLKVSPVMPKKWFKKEPKTITTGTITLTNPMVSGGGTRVYVRDRKYFLYLSTSNTPDLMEYYVIDANTLGVNIALEGKTVLVDYEATVPTTSEYFVEFEMPEFITGAVPNFVFLNWKIGDAYTELDGTFSVDHESTVGKMSWFKESVAGLINAKSWLPIEYWLSFDKNACAGVVMGDPGLSVSEWLSSPFYFGSLDQIEGALDTDLRGNFGGFSGSYSEPILSKIYGDYTGTGATDVIMAYTKTGRPYQAHKVSVFGGDAFREKTFNGQSAHTLKHAVSDIVLADVNENDRGTLQHCLAVPRVAKEHCTELIHNRYVSGKEQNFIFLNINAPYTPFNTASDVLLGFAIRTDI